MCDLISGKCLANISSLLIAVFLFIRVACCFKKFTESWDVVKNGIPEDVTHSKHWAGSFYEDQDYNIKITKSIWSCKTYYRNENKSFELWRLITIFRKVTQLHYTNPTANGMYRCIFCKLLTYHPETDREFLFDSKRQCIGRCYNGWM